MAKQHILAARLADTLTERETEHARLMDLYRRSVEAAQQAQLAALKLEAQVALLKELLGG